MANDRSDPTSESGRQPKVHGARTGAPRQMPYQRSGIAAAARFIGHAASNDAAVVFATMAEFCRKEATEAGGALIRAIPESSFDLASGTLRNRLSAADRAFSAAFGMKLFAEGPFDLRTGPADADAIATLKISSDVLDVLRHPLATASQPSAIFDECGMNWVSIAVAAARAGRGHHLTLRSAAPDDRTAADFASLAAACGTATAVIGRDDNLRRSILKSELHGGGDALTVVDGEFLVVGTEAPADDEWQIPPSDRGVLSLAASAGALVRTLGTLSNTYVWRIPGHGALPVELRGLVGACIGPLRYDAAWSAAFIKARAKGIGQDGVRALLAAFDDIRDAETIASLAETIATAAIPEAASIDEACRLLAASVRGPLTAPAGEATEPASFDERLLACGADGIALLSRGEALSRGGRVLAVGAPGGGKSTFARALGARISAARIATTSGGGVILMEPAQLLAKSWGASERLIAELFARAAREGATIVADELDSLCGVRETDTRASGNAYLIRCLTNEFLRQLDAHPDVPLIATVNDMTAIDPAVRRRFTILIEVRDELAPAQERLAWEVILEMEPPDGWSACGAAVADFASAAKRCLLLGRIDAGSHAAAIIEARDARLGPRTPRGRARRCGALH